jgi:hypothetical protein
MQLDPFGKPPAHGRHLRSRSVLGGAATPVGPDFVQLRPAWLRVGKMSRTKSMLAIGLGRWYIGTITLSSSGRFSATSFVIYDAISHAYALTVNYQFHTLHRLIPLSTRAGAAFDGPRPALGQTVL